jgi:hypothetical protein
MVAKGHRPHLWRADRRRGGLEDAADDDPVAEHVEIVILSFADEREADKTIATRYAMTVGLAGALALIENHN